MIGSELEPAVGGLRWLWYPLNLRSWERGKVAVARRRNGSDGVALGTVATARDGYRRLKKFVFSPNTQSNPERS